MKNLMLTVLLVALVLGLYSSSFSLEELDWEFKEAKSIFSQDITFPSGQKITAVRLAKIPPGSAWEYSGFQEGDMIIAVSEGGEDRWLVGTREPEEIASYFNHKITEGKKIGSVIFRVLVPMSGGGYSIHNSRYRLLKLYK